MTSPIENARRQPSADTAENSSSNYTAKSVQSRRLLGLIADCAIAGDDAISTRDATAFNRALADLNRNVIELWQVWGRT